jgi:hypothetical protein
VPEKLVSCYECAHEQSFDGTVPRSATCDACSANLRCCKNCRFYDPAAYNECAEPSAERVVDKVAATFCDFFDPRCAGGPPMVTQAPASDAKSELERLFGKK